MLSEKAPFTSSTVCHNHLLIVSELACIRRTQKVDDAIVLIGLLCLMLMLLNSKNDEMPKQTARIVFESDTKKIEGRISRKNLSVLR